MIDFTEQIEKTLREFDLLEMAVIDASSLVYLEKIGLHDILAEKIELLTVQGVVDEGAPLPEKITIIDSGAEPHTTDESVSALAYAKGIPVISEDKHVLLQVRSYGLAFFNVLMMVNFLFYREVIDCARLKEAIHALTTFAWYHADVFEYGDQVSRTIITQRNTKGKKDNEAST